MVLLSEAGNNRWALAPIRPKFQVVSQVSGVKASAFLRFCFLDSPVPDHLNCRPAAGWKRFKKKTLTINAEYSIDTTMNIQYRVILTIVSLAFALASWLPNEVSAADLKEAKVTQVIQDVRVLPSGAAPRPAAVNDNVRQGTAVQTGVQSRSELTFKDQTITRLGEKTIFSPGEGARTIDLGSGQVLLYVPKKSGGAKVKMGPVTAAITG